MSKDFEESISMVLDLYGDDILLDDHRFYAVFLDMSPKMDRERKIIKRICKEHLLKRFYEIKQTHSDFQMDMVVALKKELTVDQGFSDIWADDVISVFSKVLEINRQDRTISDSRLANVSNFVDQLRQRAYQLNEATEAANSNGVENKLAEYVLSHYFPEYKVKAIKYWREQTGWGLKEAKEAVDSLWNAGPSARISIETSNSSNLNETQLCRFVLNNYYPNYKVKAIKYWREQTGWGLKESKEKIDFLWSQR